MCQLAFKEHLGTNDAYLFIIFGLFIFRTKINTLYSMALVRKNIFFSRI